MMSEKFYSLLKTEIKPDSVDDQKREFESWGSVEVFDNQNHKIAAEAIEKVMPVMMKRGGTLLRTHSNLHVGNIIDWEMKDALIRKPNGTVAKKPGVLLRGKINSDFSIDDEAWNDIKKGMITGLSLGGRGINKTRGCDEDSCGDIFDDIELWEWSLTDRKHPPANPYAGIIEYNELAKSDATEETTMADDSEILQQLARIEKKVDDACGCSDGHEAEETGEEELIEEEALEEGLDTPDTGAPEAPAPGGLTPEGPAVTEAGQ